MEKIVGLKGNMDLIKIKQEVISYKNSPEKAVDVLLDHAKINSPKLQARVRKFVIYPTQHNLAFEEKIDFIVDYLMDGISEYKFCKFFNIVLVDDKNNKLSPEEKTLLLEQAQQFALQAIDELKNQGNMFEGFLEMSRFDIIDEETENGINKQPCVWLKKC